MECNSKKRDKLAQEEFLIKISNRNESMFEHFGNKSTEADSGKRIKMIYNWAQKNGYNEIWIPTAVKA